MNLKFGDIRYYLNRNNKDIVIKITRLDDDGSVYAQTFKEGTPFRIPNARIRNIGEKLTSEEIQALKRPRAQMPVIPPTPIVKPKKEEPEMKPVTPGTPEGKPGEVIELKPIEDVVTKEPPEEVDDKDDAEELIK